VRLRIRPTVRERAAPVPAQSALVKPLALGLGCCGEEIHTAMNKNLRLFLLAVIALALFPSLGCDKLRARDQLNKGVEAYKNNHYEQAIDHFQLAVQLDPNLLNARMYLAAAFVTQYVPGVLSDDNLRVAHQAIDEYQKVIDANPSRDQKVNAAKGIAYLYLNMKQFDDAKKYYRMASDLDPNDPEPYYSIGVIDWTACYAPRMEERASLGLKPDEHLNPKNKDQKKVCDELKVKNGPTIQEGLDILSRAIQLRPDYDDAMAYLNLMYRERADVECDDLDARTQDLKAADHWQDEVMRVRKIKAENEARKAGGGITTEETK
jgi:tetratricopeptide (TPR) repeat protein